MNHCFKCSNARATKYGGIGCVLKKVLIAPFGSCKDFEEGKYFVYDVDKFKKEVVKKGSKTKK